MKQAGCAKSVCVISRQRVVGNTNGSSVYLLGLCTALWKAGLSLSYHTDNRLMSCITQSSEAAALLTHTALQEYELLAMATQAAHHSFLSPEVRQQAILKIGQWRAA